ncbi:MAG: HAD hydrolase-like protein [Cytophagales bacterium]|nr:HAD hydrolase-like protein [Cytophagales bacterium]
MEIKLVVFDMAGTTVRDYDNVHEAIQEALSNHDVFVTRDEVNKVMGLPKPIAIEALLKNEFQQDEIKEEFIDAVYNDFVEIMVDFYKNDPMVKEQEGAGKIFSLLKENRIKVALDTGFSRIIADTIIDRLEWNKNQLIDFSISSDEVEHGRPFPDMIFAAMDNLGILNVNQVAKVGDTISDMEEGKSAGCRYIVGITSGAYSREQLEKTPHTHLIEKLDELPKILGIHT